MPKTKKQQFLLQLKVTTWCQLKVDAESLTEALSHNMTAHDLLRVAGSDVSIEDVEMETTGVFKA